jgi:predicted amidohydrolase
MTQPAKPENMRIVRVAVAQIAPALGDFEENLAAHRDAIEKARDQGAGLVVFPELSLTGYRLKDMVPEVAIRRDIELATEVAPLSAGIAVVVGFVEESGEHHYYNSAAYFEDGRLVHVHRKVYLPTYGMFDEQRYFARGNRISAFGTRSGRTAMLICEDALHPTALTVAALDGASTIIVPAASPARGVVGEGEVDANGKHWESYVRAMARTLGVHIVFSNRIGVEDGHTFWGGSEIIGPEGDPLAKAAYYTADLIEAEMSEDAVRRRRLQAPILRDEDLDLTINELMRVRGRPDQKAMSADRGSHVSRGGPPPPNRPRPGGGPPQLHHGRPPRGRPERRRRGGGHRQHDRRPDFNDPQRGVEAMDPERRRQQVAERFKPEPGERKPRPVDPTRATSQGDDPGDDLP